MGSKFSETVDRVLGRTLGKTLGFLMFVAAVIAAYLTWGAWTTGHPWVALLCGAACFGALFLARYLWRMRRLSDFDLDGWEP